ncbi:hypothetical protein QYE76_068489 [Lolium multiflorum]|uniref:CCHC-type domain-containing protein n=1 Tax=Lolium multiflorum TaxID=4521 RepID=A0AAD8SEW8_LOLMU|nr:hypothetical protein QYE76_068489 [Lolium multiflorum]
MMNQNGPHHTQKYRNNSSGVFTPRHNKPPAQSYRPNYNNNNGGPPKTGGNNNNSHNNNNHPNSNNNNGNNNNTNTAPRTGSNTTPITPKDKATINCYECGVVGHYSNECPKKLAKIAANTAALSRIAVRRRNQNNNNGRLYHMNATEAQEAPRPCQVKEKKPKPWPGVITTPRPRQSVHWHDSGRASTLPRLIASVLPSISSLARARPSDPASQ